MPSKLERQAEQLAALGHPVRLAILRFLVQGDKSGTAAGDIQSHLDVPASTLSHHLRRLVDASLLSERVEGSYHFYAARYDSLRGLTDYLWEDCCGKGEQTC